MTVLLNSMTSVIKKAFSVFVSIGISLGIMSSFWADTDISLRALIVRESIRTICQSLPNEGGITGFTGIDMSKISVFVAPIGYSNEKFDVDGLPVEVLTNKNSKNSDKVIFQLHGGAYVYGMNDLYRIQALRWSKKSEGATVVTIDYRIAPDNVFPAALEDALKAWNWMLEKGYLPENIIVVGDSAGGNLALALGLTLRDEGKELPLAMVLMSPWADLAAEGESCISNIYKDPMFGIPEKEEIPEDKKAVSVAYAGETDLHDPILSPVYAEYNGFCPMLIQCGTYEVLQSSSETVAEKATAAGVDVTLTEYTGMWHMFQLFGNLFAESKAAWQEAGDYLTRQFYS